MKRKYLYIILITLVILVASISLAYAALSSTLSISGSVDVVASSWDVHFENAQFVSTISNDGVYDYKVQPLRLVHESCDGSYDCIRSDDATSLNFTATAISKPGDFKVIQFDVVNGGTIDAKLGNYTLTGLSSEQDVYLNYYVIHADGSSISNNELLNAGERTSMKLVLEFDKNVNANQLPTTTQNLSLSFTMNYIQAD